MNGGLSGHHERKCKDDEEWSRSIYNTRNNQRRILEPEEDDEDDLNST
jgi:hypothetical protein